MEARLMRNLLTTFVWLVLLIGVGSVTLSLTHGQDSLPPMPVGPVVKPSRPIVITPPKSAPAPSPTVVSPKPSRDLSKLSALQKQMYFSARRGAAWLARMNEVKGRFVHGWQPSLNVALEGDHALRQAGAAFALARAARYLAEPGQAGRARQAVLALLEDTVEDGETKARHSVLPSAIVNRVSYAALVVLAIHELPDPDNYLLARSDQLCEFLRRQQRADGSLRCREVVAGGRDEDDTLEAQEYPGQALYALMRSQEHRPATWKTEVVRKATAYYAGWWREHKGREFVAWHTAACAEAYLLTKEKPFADAVFAMNDWLCELQHERLDGAHPQWLGGFQNVVDGKVIALAPDVTSAVGAESLAEACRVARALNDKDRQERYSAALVRALQFLTTLQYGEADTQHFADWYRPQLLGGFHLNHQDGNLRIDHAQHAVSALVQYLRHVALVQ
jgi:hypothetical protein